MKKWIKRLINDTLDERERQKPKAIERLIIYCDIKDIDKFYECNNFELAWKYIGNVPNEWGRLVYDHLIITIMVNK